MARVDWPQHPAHAWDVPQTASGRFWFMFLLMGSVLIVGVVLWYAGGAHEPIRGFAL